MSMRIRASSKRTVFPLPVGAGMGQDYNPRYKAQNLPLMTYNGNARWETKKMVKAAAHRVALRIYHLYIYPISPEAMRNRS